MNIGICTNIFHPHVGGCEVVTYKIANHLHENGHRVTIYTRKLPNRKKAHYPYPVVEYLPSDCRLFLASVRQASLDFLFIYSDVFDFFRQCITEHLGCQIVLAPCGANWIHQNKHFANIVQNNLFKIRSIVCHSTCDRDYKLFYSDKTKEKISVIPNGVDLYEFDQNQITREELLPEHIDKQWIVNIANFFPGKGQNHLVNILQKGDFKNVVYVQISSDIIFPIGKNLEDEWNKTSSLKLGKNVFVHLVKNAPRQTVVGFLKQSNVLACTSEKEVAPITILEAMACATPWVAASTGNIPDLKGGMCIRTAKTPNHFCVFNGMIYKSFAHAIRNLLLSPKIAESGRLQIENEMTWERILPKYLDIFSK